MYGYLLLNLVTLRIPSVDAGFKNLSHVISPSFFHLPSVYYKPLYICPVSAKEFFNEFFCGGKGIYSQVVMHLSPHLFQLIS